MRYNFLGTQIDASLNNSRINDIATNATNAIGDQIATRVESALEKAKTEIASTSADLGAPIANAVLRTIRIRELERLILRDRDIRKLVRDDVIVRTLTGGAVRRALSSYIRASAAAKAAQVRGTIDASLEAAAANAKQKLSKAIAKNIEDVTPTYGAGDQYWFDPIVGLRGQINFTRWLYLEAQGDVGGFSAGSQIAWNVQAALGFNFTRNIFAELGYRYMYVDYENDGFLYNMNSYGLYSSIGFKF
ncbi:MAG: hypothetical protein ACOVMP_05095 [Chthoniobacterales bacterium]